MEPRHHLQPGPSDPALSGQAEPETPLTNAGAANPPTDPVGPADSGAPDVVSHEPAQAPGWPHEARSPIGERMPARARTIDDISERILGGRRKMRRSDVARHAGVPLGLARRLWRALGLQNARAEDTIFTEVDLEALRLARSLTDRYEIDEDLLLSLTRAVGTTTERLATWQAEIIAERLQSFEREQLARTHEQVPPDRAIELGDGSEGLAERSSAEVVSGTGLVLSDVADDLSWLITYSWRRHLTGALSTLLADATAQDPERGVHRSVGFADMVSFTERVERSSEHDVARLVTRFEELVADIVAHYGGRVVKTIGDEVLYQSTDPATALRIAHDLVQRAGADPMLPPLRIGVGTGRVLLRLGDVYGGTVNRAARLTGSAAAGTVLMDLDSAAALPEDSPWRVAQLAPRTLRGMGEVTPYQLLSAPPSSFVPTARTPRQEKA